MERERIEQALERIEAAAGRIECAAARPAALPAPDPALAEKHARLQAEVGAALGDLDRLIGSLGDE
ncbi:hypothetical protein [Altericroceibacterium xinjiangense]|uniref:hypothetical protein n=1 Tax=Altericroceibacterium xinjiangense TaxID=762261 RepID=UPI000F7FA916|nr:hypothetical protein [Altericroceibacterium xinjiangense]